jgi:hypothetical protein
VPRVSSSDAAIHGTPPKPRVRIVRQWRRDPVTAREWLAKNWIMSWTGPEGVTVCRSTRTSDRAKAEAIAQAFEAQLGEPRRPGAGK